MDKTILAAIISAVALVVASAVGGYFTGRRGGGNESSSASIPPPKVVATNPPDLDEEGPPNIRVTANFSKDMDGATINPNTFKLLDSSTLTPVPPAASNGVYYDEVTRMAIFSPAHRLENGRRYMAAITARVKDQAGNRLEQDKIWHFAIRKSEHP